MSGWADWLAFGLALAFTIGAVALGFLASRDGLEAANHEDVLDELWGPDEEWVEP